MPLDQETGILAVQAKMPTFSKHNIKLFFAQLDSAFMLNKIEDETIKYNYLINILDTEILYNVSDLVFTIPPQTPFTTIKDKLLKIFENSVAQNAKALLQELTLGDQKPSVLLRKMRDMASGLVTDDFLKNLCLQRLPSNIQTVLAVSNDGLDKLAALADKVSELTMSHNVSSVAAISESNEIKILQLQISELSKKFDALATSNANNRSRYPFHNRQRSPSRNRSHSRDRRRDPNICFYHSRFGSRARNCTPPCSFNQAENDTGASQ